MDRISDDSFTRPANATQYSAGDVMGELLEFFTDQKGKIEGALLVDSTAEATKPEADLMLFDAAPTVAADNAAFAPSDDEMKRCVGVIPFLAANFKVGNGNGVTAAATTTFPLPYFAAAKKLYGVLIARNTYTPVSEEIFTLRLAVDID
jgi:hypothetical protein